MVNPAAGYTHREKMRSRNAWLCLLLTCLFSDKHIFYLKL